MNTEKRTITAKEVARILGTSQMMVKEMVKRGILPGDVINISGRDRIIIPRARFFDEYLGEAVDK